ncbi:hypothetical protein BWQ96_07276 [Gracilariopsis chorda]|uniref:Retrovirus-related Pol polyprotein from transposon TNT 1-94-like beta-barrel domain-containing protein n=1 Tax=Gracilariopsis chorda TaxID=448386 RepID=A0A2V3ILK9_9FLOR|nr:hypothetical protein BWQ96_07276 [Gracilariopsis chorda]|eukprot:PXF42972.1 hypothetical protein BWQ96_07276 [Gracilariopsis chorda]
MELKRYIPQSVGVGDGSHTAFHAKGDIHATDIMHGRNSFVTFTDVQYAPGLNLNLLSVVCMRKKDFFINFKSDERNSHGTCTVTDPETNEVCLMGIECRHTGLYEALRKPFYPTVESRSLVSKAKILESRFCHNLLGHLCEQHLRKTVPIVDGMPLRRVNKWGICDNSKISQSVRDTRLRRQIVREFWNSGDLVHTEVVGPMRILSVRRARDCVTLYEDSSA